LCGVRVRVCGCVWHFNSVFLVVVGAFQRGLMQSIHKARLSVHSSKPWEPMPPQHV